MNVIVIGGGPAGALAATLLARGGVRVTLVEQSRFPRDKVCGECLSALGLQVLGRHGLADRLLAVGRSLTTSHLFGRDARVTVALPEPMLGVSRSFMDAALLDGAVAAGVVVRQPARVEAVEPGDDAVSVRVRCLVENRVTVEAADVAIVADGRDALGGRRRPPTGDLGVKAHFESVAADPAAVTLYGGLGCYGGVAPIEGGRWNVAFSVPRERVAAVRGDLAAWWTALVAKSAVLSRHFAGARRVSDWLASPLPRHAPDTAWPARVIPVGAAAGAIEPVGGEGMGTALRSAELAAEAVLAGTTDRLPCAYADLWRRRSLTCRLGGRMLADAEWSEAVTLAGGTAAGRAAMWLVGK